MWLFFMFNSTKNAVAVLMNVPFALIGGILALFITGIHFSISAGVGFIALFGVSVQNGVILVSVFNKLKEGGANVRTSIIDGALSRVRPVVMTALMAGFGLLPAALITLPAIYLIWHRKSNELKAWQTMPVQPITDLCERRLRN